MTREIKFRGWDTEYREWRDDFTILPTGQVLDVDGKAAPTIVLVQFTGLKDKNGKEIYEGDIVRTLDTGNLFEVIFDDKAASFKIVERSDWSARRLLYQCQ